jgi:hypothetical protein
MNEIMALALLVMQAGIIAGIGYTCYNTGYNQGYRAGMDMQKLLGKAFDDKGDGEA